ncbi:MAG: single-stranded-DNA-specific exonuclease RecJ [Planctomycetota bacterium]
MARRWILSPRNPELAMRLAEGLNVHPVVGELLINRGVASIEAGRRFLNRKLVDLHDPVLHPGITEAADLIHEAIGQQKNICIYGDYDVDGMCATAILLECLRLGGTKPRFYVPDRLEEGYGLNSDALARLKDEGIDLVITVDCGVSSWEEANFARQIGLTLIVTDHHEYSELGPAPADVVVHPRLPGSQYPFGGLCGTGVAYKLAWELARRFSGGSKTTDLFQKFLLDATSLAAVGTVCDVVPLNDENRVLVHHGLRSLKAEPPMGLACLMELAGMASKAKLDSGDLGFVIGPRLNACGRLGQARLGVELLTTKDKMRAWELARYLEEENKKRQSVERKIFTEARELAEKQYDIDDKDACPVLVLASENWHPGVIGIVASRMVERYHRPCLMIALGDGEGAGSGRSVPGFHLQQALAACGEHLIKSGGHAMAAGLRVRRDSLDRFRESFEELARGQLAAEDLAGEIQVDVEVPLHVLNPSLLAKLEVMQPFGLTNPSPTMLATNLNVVGEPRKVGGGERHLMFRVAQGGKSMKAIAFGLAERAEELMSQEGKCCVVFRPIISEYRGYPEVELQVKDFCAGSMVNQEVGA